MESCGAKVLIESDEKIMQYLIDNREKLEFPNLNIITDTSNLNVTYLMKYINGPKTNNTVQYTDSSIIATYPQSELILSNIVYLAKPLLEKQFALMGRATCHSACVAKDGKAILLLGDAGSGKTSLAVNLCLKNGYSLISNDKTLIGLENGNMNVYGGTKFINLRYRSVENNMPELIHLFGRKDVESWSEKVQVMAHEIGIKEEYETLPIDEIYFIHVDAREKKLTVKDGDMWRNNFLLYQTLTEALRTTDSAFVDKKGHPIGYLPSFDNEECFRKRIDLMNAMNHNPHYKYISGNLQETLSYIEEMRDREKGDNHIGRE